MSIRIDDIYVRGEAKLRKRYCTMDERLDDMGDVFVRSYYTRSEAVSAAEEDWSYLTDDEKSERRILVCCIDPADVPDDVLGELDIIGLVDEDDLDKSFDDNWVSNFSCAKILCEYSAE